MAQRNDDPGTLDRDLGPESDDEDDRLGEAIEEYLALAERDQAPDLEDFLDRYEDVKDELRAALEGLELVHGLVGRGGGGSGSFGSSRGGGPSRWLESGHRIAGYRIVRELGRGGMGTVYEAVHLGLDRPVALKVLGTHAAPDSSARRRFLNEARTAAGLHHTHIVPVFDVGQVGGLCYYAMQRIEGSGLDRVVRHLRRSRPSGVGPAGTSSLVEGPAASGASSLGSRFGQIWMRVSPGWLWRQPRHSSPTARRPGATAAAARDRTGHGPGLTRSGLDGPGLLPPIPSADSTASWGIRPGDRLAAREAADAPFQDSADDPTGSMISMTGLPTRKGADAPGRGDEPPPFEPPKGSAYFRWVASVGLQAADALAHAHHQGVIHRDVKPSNLLVDAEGSIWVTDFGLARRLADPGLTHHDSLLGTPRYMSPEQARAAGQVDGRTDVYSLGATLYELLTLRPPFDGQSAAELVDQIGRDDPAPPRNYEPRIPRDLETIVLKALAKRPVDRYANASEFAEDLARFLSYAPVKARRIGPVGRVWRIARRHPQSAAITATAAALIVAIATYSYVRILDKQAEVIEALEIANEKGSALEDSNARLVSTMRKHHLQTAQMLESLDGPDRRAQGLEQIRKAVELGIPAAERPGFRDEAVTFLVMRDVETRPALQTGRGHALVFGPQGHRLWFLSDDGELLSLWDVAENRRLTQVSLRNEPIAEDSAAEALASPTGGEKVEAGTPRGVAAATAAGRGRTRSVASGGPGQRRGSLAVVGNCIAVLGPDGNAVTLIDPLSGATLRRLTSPGHTILGMIADPAGKRLVTVEEFREDPAAEAEAMLEGLEPSPAGSEYRLNLWDLDRLDHPRATIRPRRGGPRSPGPGSDRPPMAAISPDGRTIAVASFRGTSVRLYSAEDGSARPSRSYVDTQSEVWSLALGPDGLMAVAGNDQMIRLYDLDSQRAFVTGLKPGLSLTRLMRFSPTGALALAGIGGKIELWDPAAASRVAALPGSEQSVDLAFSPDGRTLAAAGWTESTPIWTIHDSAARAQLSGFEARATSLAFGPGGSLAIGGWDGAVSTWQKGRCPESGPAMPMPVAASGALESSSASASKAAVSPSREAGPARGPDSRPHSRGESSGRGRDGRPQRGSLPYPAARPAVLAFDAEGRLLAHDMTGLRVWPAGPRPVHQAPASHELSSGSFTWMPMARTSDGRTMALLRVSSVFLWHVERPDRLVPVRPPAPPAPAAGAASPPNAVSAPSANRLAASGTGGEPPAFLAVQIAPAGDRLYLIDMGGRLNVWDLATTPDGREVRASEADRPLVAGEGNYSLSLRPDGAILALGDRTGNVSLYDTVDRRRRGTIGPIADESGGFSPALAFSSDGRTLAIGSQQGAISLYALASPDRPHLRLRLPGHHGRVSSLAFEASGHRLASASWSDPLVEVWDLALISQELARLGLAE